MTSYTLTFKNATDLKFAPGLVLGWMTTDEMQNETLYAQHASGRVMRSEPVPAGHRYRTEFAPKGRKWTKVEAVPANAEFTGNYKPTFIRSAGE